MISTMSNEAHSIPNIRSLRPLGPEDQACLDEVRQVLSKYGALQRFGVTLLHNHFPLAEDEFLEEYCDEENRTMTLKPVRQSEFKVEDVIFTAWNLGTGAPIIGCKPVEGD